MDVIKPLLNRIAQPVFFSFCISWILWNWEIVIALLWYDAESIKLTKSDTFMQYIKLQKDGWRNYVLPLISALLFLPIRYGVNWLNAFFRTKEKTDLLQITGTGKMSTLRFLELKKSYDERIAQISKFIDKEAELQTELNQTIISLGEANSKLSAYKEDIRVKNEENETLKVKTNLFMKYSELSFLTGNYIYTITEIEDDYDRFIEYELNSDKLIIENLFNKFHFVFYDGNLKIKFLVHTYFYNILNNESLIILKLDEETVELLNDNFNKLEKSNTIVNTLKYLNNEVLITKNISENENYILLNNGVKITFKRDSL